MANVNNITIDLVSGTAVLTMTNGGNPLETITYTDSTKILSFANRSLLNISATDFISYTNQFYIYQTAILSNFNTNIFTTSPFTEFNNVLNNNTGSNSYDFYCVAGYAPLGRILDYSALGSNSTVNVKNRQFTLTANFTEWVYLLDVLRIYQNYVKSFFSL